MLSTFHRKDCTPLKMKAVCKNTEKNWVTLKVLKHTASGCGKLSIKSQFRKDGGSKPLFKKTSEHQQNLVGNTSLSLFSKLKIRNCVLTFWLLLNLTHKFTLKTFTVMPKPNYGLLKRERGSAFKPSFNYPFSLQMLSILVMWSCLPCLWLNLCWVDSTLTQWETTCFCCYCQDASLPAGRAGRPSPLGNGNTLGQGKLFWSQWQLLLHCQWF